MKKNPKDRLVRIVFVPPIDVLKLTDLEGIEKYRKKVIRIAKNAEKRIEKGGYFVLGAHDRRLVIGIVSLFLIYLVILDDLIHSFKFKFKFKNIDNRVIYCPLTALIYEDICKYTSSFVIKEIVSVVPNGFQKDKNTPIESIPPIKYIANLSSTQIPYLPIVQSFYYLFVKKEKL